jgi:phosphatidylserine decarboxylase
VLAPLTIILALILLFWIDVRALPVLTAGIIVQGFFLFFFRDPHRPIGEGIVSPADGVICEVEDRRIAIFMNVWDVHVNRVPVKGTIISMQHVPGRHAPAYGKISHNERLVTTIDTDDGLLTLIQIAGIFARRIVPYVDIGDKVTKGQRLGIVRFGSRVDIEVPKKVDWKANIGEKVRAGNTIGQLD